MGDDHQPYPASIASEGEAGARMGAELASITMLNALNTRPTATSDLPSILDEMLDVAIKLQDADFGDVQLYDETTGTLKIVAHRGLNQEFLDYFKTVDAGESSACGLALRSGTRVIIEDATIDPDFEPHRRIAASTGFRGVQSTPLLDRGSGKPLGMLSTHFREPRRPSEEELRLTDVYVRQAADVIAFRLAERVGPESEVGLRAVVDLVKLGSYAWNPQTNELQWNDTLRAMWGLPAGVPVDYEMWRARVHPDDIARVEAAIERCADPQGNGVYDIEYRVIGKADGAERWIAVRGQTHFESRVPVWFYGVAMDVSDRKEIEQTLARRVEERTRELEEANRQLRTQIEQREIAEAEVQQLQRLDAIGQITSGVAHDFNNLLSVVVTNAALLSRNWRDPGDLEGLELIRSAAERGANLTRQLLAFSRKQRLQPQKVDLNRKITEMGELLSATFGGTVELRTAMAAGLWPALVDPTQIELMILNLAINARDAMQAGGTLTLETFNAVIDSGPVGPEDLAPGYYVGLAVSDTGVGIPDDVLPRVFEPFFTTKQSGKGSGLGLAQAFGFTKQSGGGVRIETRVGRGTSVKVFLPRAEAAVSERERETAGLKPGLQSKVNANILVVDDDRAVLKTSTRLLDALGFAAVAAASGREALQLLASGVEIDLVLADFAMPEMTGVELAKTIQSAHPAVPVILVTGYGDREVLKNLRDARILQKPYADHELLEEITRALN
jgi:PAS domain S-box-containing protein